jgi:hypothetical protein
MPWTSCSAHRHSFPLAFQHHPQYRFQHQDTEEGTEVDQAEKVRENRLRRMADRQGLTLTRSRRRDTRALDFGKYWLHRGDALVSPEQGIDLDEVEALLTR